MKIEEVIAEVMEIAGEGAVQEELDMPGPVLRVPRESLAKVMPLLRQRGFDSLMALSGIDYQGMKKYKADAGDSLGVVYHLFSFAERCKITIKVWLPREDPQVFSVAAIWPTAEWHEREAYDMFGIRFEGHPDPRRILLPEDWEGWPLRKDYQMPTEYRGIVHRDEEGQA